MRLTWNYLFAGNRTDLLDAHLRQVVKIHAFGRQHRLSGMLCDLERLVSRINELQTAQPAWIEPHLDRQWAARLSLDACEDGVFGWLVSLSRSRHDLSEHFCLITV